MLKLKGNQREKERKKDRWFNHIHNTQTALKDLKLWFSRSMHQCRPCQPFSRMCPFYPGYLLLGSQELRLVAVWSSLVLALVLLDEFCLFCFTSFIHEKNNNFIEHQIRLCQDHQSTKTQRESEKWDDKRQNKFIKLWIGLAF